MFAAAFSTRFFLCRPKTLGRRPRILRNMSGRPSGRLSSNFCSDVWALAASGLACKFGIGSAAVSYSSCKNSMMHCRLSRAPFFSLENFRGPNLPSTGAATPLLTAPRILRKRAVPTPSNRLKARWQTGTPRSPEAAARPPSSSWAGLVVASRVPATGIHEKPSENQKARPRTERKPGLLIRIPFVQTSQLQPYSGNLLRSAAQLL